MVVLSTARHFYVVDETRGLYVELERIADDMYLQSRSDPLTGLDNRRALFDSFDALIARCSRTGESLCAVMIDLDLFKDYNDHFGHLAGDAMLRKVASVMNREKRGQDVVSRYGGEEFCILLPATDVMGAVKLMHKIRAGCISDWDLGEGITFSAGVAQWNGLESTDDLVRRSDEALYQAKAAGRDRVVVAQSDRLSPTSIS
jgi:diguanylate cyclase (GGDEF)-like protein